MIKASIVDRASRLSTEVDNNSGFEKSALVVAMRPLKRFENSVRFFSNATHGVDMNINAAAGGTPEEVHDGTDNAYWTGSEPIGTKATFDSGDRANSGTKSVKWDKPSLNDVVQFDKGSDLTVSSYASLTLFVNVDKDWTAGDSVSIFGWDTGTTSVVGNTVLLEDYINELDFDTWQKATIALTDLGLTSGTIDALRMEVVGIDGKAPKFYIDDIQFEETGEPVEFVLEPETGTWLYVHSLTISMADAFDTTVSDGTVQGVPYNNFLGVPLVSGIGYRREQGGEIKFDAIITGSIDLMQFPGTVIQSGGDATNAWVSFNVPMTEPFLLKAEHGDRLIFIMNDDLSGLLWLRVTAGCKKEDRR